jgi:hypothetical protein
MSEYAKADRARPYEVGQITNSQPDMSYYGVSETWGVVIFVG